MKILVCGGTGFVGRNTVEHFLRLGYEVHATCYRRDPYDGPVWHTLNLCEQSPVAELFENNKFDVVIQAAAATTGCKDTLNDPAMHIATNAVMNSFIFRAAMLAGVGHVIFPSCSVMLPDGFNTEDTEPQVNDKYYGFAHTKLFCENMCKFYSMCSDTRFTVFRNTNFFGKYDKYDLDRSHFLGATITKVMQAEDHITLWGDGQERRDFLPVQEFCRIVEAAIANQKTKFELFNCGSGVAMKIQEAAEKIVALSGKNLRIDYDTSKPTIKTSLSLDCSKAKELIGWEPVISFEDGIRETLGWYKENVQ